MRWFKKSKKSLTLADYSPPLGPWSLTAAEPLDFGGDLELNTDPEGVLRSD